MCAAEVLSREAVQARALALLDAVLDPEVPALSVRDLGLVRELTVHDDGLEVVLTPTYSGCPATEVIAQSVREALQAGGFAEVRVTQRLAPAWTSDWITEEGRRKLLAYGIVPPGPVLHALPEGVQPLRFHARRGPPTLACPRCASLHTEQLSAFGSTACKSTWRCRACGEPFEHFKPI